LGAGIVTGQGRRGDGQKEREVLNCAMLNV
jgi:hypothetical protein